MPSESYFTMANGQFLVQKFTGLNLFHLGRRILEQGRPLIHGFLWHLSVLLNEGFSKSVKTGSFIHCLYLLFVQFFYIFDFSTCSFRSFVIYISCSCRPQELTDSLYWKWIRGQHTCRNCSFFPPSSEQLMIRGALRSLCRYRCVCGTDGLSLSAGDENRLVLCPSNLKLSILFTHASYLQFCQRLLWIFVIQ